MAEPLMGQEASLYLADHGIDPDTLDDSAPLAMVLIHAVQQYVGHQVQAFAHFAELRIDLVELGDSNIPHEPIANFLTVRQYDEARLSMDALESTVQIAITAYKRAHGLHVRPSGD